MINDINTETPNPRWIEFTSIEDFNSAMYIIEAWDKSQEKIVRKLPQAPEPDLTKPYTEYDEENLRIWANENVINILG